MHGASHSHEDSSSAEVSERITSLPPHPPCTMSVCLPSIAAACMARGAGRPLPPTSTGNHRSSEATKISVSSHTSSPSNPPNNIRAGEPSVNWQAVEEWPTRGFGRSPDIDIGLDADFRNGFCLAIFVKIMLTMASSLLSVLAQKAEATLASRLADGSQSAPPRMSSAARRPRRRVARQAARLATPRPSSAPPRWSLCIHTSVTTNKQRV